MDIRIGKLAALATACFLLGSNSFAASNFSGASKDAWITGKVETVFMLNPHLNGFTIDTEVDNGFVRLTGMVPSDIDRDLAEELAENIEGVVEVENAISVHSNTRDASHSEATRQRRSFGTFVDDATTTAAVKSRLVANGNTRGLQIDVDTSGDIVTLSGRVASGEEKMLAEEIARGTGDVEDVRNNLVVDPQ